MKIPFNLQVVNVVEDIYRHESTDTKNEDVYEDWEHVILQTLKNSPLKVRIQSEAQHLGTQIRFTLAM